jgi:tetratricopeptide (TPR) repeat protein
MKNGNVMRAMIGIALTGAISAGRSYAQPADAIADAERLFNEARELAKASRWAEACPRFEDSLRADPALGTRLNLATCYENLGQLTRAWELYRESADIAERTGDTERRDFARSHAEALEPRLPRRATSPDATKPPSVPAAGSAGPAAPPSQTRVIAAVGLGTAGLASVGVGLLFGANARARRDEAKAICGDELVCEGNATARLAQQSIHDARSDAAVSTVLVIAGSAVIAAGVVLYLTRPTAHERRTAAVVPVANQRSAGLALIGSF